jgi:hypothetical protein
MRKFIFPMIELLPISIINVRGSLTDIFLVREVRTVAGERLNLSAFAGNWRWGLLFFLLWWCLWLFWLVVTWQLQWDRVAG